MPTVTVDGEKSFEVEAGKETGPGDRGRRHRHHAPLRRQCPVHHVPRRGPGRRSAPDGATRARAAGARDRPRAQHPALMSNPRAERPLGPRHQPLIGHRRSARNAADGLISASRSRHCEPSETTRRLASPGNRALSVRRSLVLLRLGAFLAAHGAPANLAAAARAAMKLGLTEFLLAGTERHGEPHEADLKPRNGSQNLESRVNLSHEIEARQCKRKLARSGQSKRHELRSASVCSRVQSFYSLLFGGRITSPFTPGRSSRNSAPGSPPVM